MPVKLSIEKEGEVFWKTLRMCVTCQTIKLCGVLLLKKRTREEKSNSLNISIDISTNISDIYL